MLCIFLFLISPHNEWEGGKHIFESVTLSSESIEIYMTVRVYCIIIYSIYIERENKKDFLGTLNAKKKNVLFCNFFWFTT